MPVLRVFRAAPEGALARRKVPEAVRAVKRERRRTKGERRSGPPVPAVGPVRCVGCGKELGACAFETASAILIVCGHGSGYAACAECEVEAMHMVRQHEMTGRPVSGFAPK